MGTVFLWILLAAAAAFAILGFVFALLAFNREGYDDTGLLAALATLQECCDVVSTGVGSLLTSMTTVLSNLSLIVTNTQTLLLSECIPLTAPGPIAVSGCYFFANQIAFTGALNAVAFPISVDDVEIDMKGLSLHVVNDNTHGFSVINAANVRVYNGRVFTFPISSNSASRAFDVNNGTDLRLEGLVISGFPAAVRNQGSNGFRIISSTIENGSGQNATALFGNDNQIYLIGVNNTLVSKCFFRNNSVIVNSTAAAFLGHAINSRAQNGLPCDGLIVEDSIFTNSRFRTQSVSTTAGSSNIRLSGCQFKVDDPSFKSSFIEIGDTDTLGNGTDIATIPPNGVTIEDCTMTNLNAHPEFDGILVKMAIGLRIVRNTITSTANGSAPADGQTTAALIRLGSAGTSVGYREINAFGVTGALVADNKLIGRPFASDPSNNRANIGVFVEAFSRDIDIVANSISGMGAGVPANPSPNGTCAFGAYPAQTPAGVFVAYGASGVRILRNKIWDGSCANGAATIPADGIVLSTNATLTAYCPTGYGPIYFPPADSCLVQENEIWDFCGHGVNNQATNSRVVGNVAWNNAAGNYADTGAPATIVQGYGAAVLTGSNLSG